jgi:hypothetical protein
MRLRAAVVAVLALAAPALIVPAVTAPAQAAGPRYPATTCATLYVSTTHPLPGASLAVTGKEFTAHAAVTVEIAKPSTVLKRVRTDADGSFSTTVRLPDGLTGKRVITAVGGQTTTCPVDPIQLAIQGGAPNPAAGGTPNGGGTAFTGLDVAGLLAIAVALIGAGVLLNRRRRAPSTSS